MGGGGGVCGQRFGVAEVVGDFDEAEGVHRLEGGGFAAFDFEGDERAASGHLRHGEVALGVVGAGGVPDAGDLRLGGEEIGDGGGGAASGVDAQRQGFDAFEQEPGVEGRDRGAGIADEGLQRVLDPFGAAEHRATENASLAVDMFGAGVDDDVGAELEGFLQQRGGEDVVDHDDCAGRVGEVGHRLEVDDFEHRVRGGFEQDEVSRGGQGGAPLRHVGAVDEFGGDAVAGQQGGDDPVAGTEEGAGGDDAVAGLEVAEQSGVDGGHASGGGATGLGALDEGEAGFEHGHGGVAEAGVLEVFDVAFEGGFGLFGVVIDEAGGEVERLGGFAEMRALDAALHEQGGGTVGGGSGHRMGPLRQEMGRPGCSERTGFHTGRWPL